MATALLGLLGVLLCALAHRSLNEPTCTIFSASTESARFGCLCVDVSFTQVSGKWYLIGFATNAEWFVARKANMKMGIAVLTPTDEGDLEMAYSSLNPDGTCWRMNHLAQKTDIPGKFSFRSERWETDNGYARVVDVKYDEYALIHTIKTKADSTVLLNKLYGRTPDLSQDVVYKFTEFSLEQGILPENIAILPKNDECP
ncbi:lipocalin-like [Puntigrus tetrazona]|uniref:lipocalin-like n=1 Tax=Puntigrus tetrazona TaxID=1606681 RepID=UPI001C8A8990|nr:lipocalin-like [Puntigrus tetrazona]